MHQSVNVQRKKNKNRVGPERDVQHIKDTSCRCRFSPPFFFFFFFFFFVAVVSLLLDWLQVLKSGSESATKLVSTYGRIDVLRPYFDIDTKDLRQRLLASMWPRLSRQPQVCSSLAPLLTHSSHSLTHTPSLAHKLTHYLSLFRSLWKRPLRQTCMDPSCSHSRSQLCCCYP